MKILFRNFLTLAFIFAFAFAVYSFFYPSLLYRIVDSTFSRDAYIHKMMNYSWDKQGHFFYIGFCALMFNYLLRSKKISVRGFSVLLGSVILMCLTLVEELRQYFIPNRNFELMDLLAGYLGIITFGFMGGWLYRYLSK